MGDMGAQRPPWANSGQALGSEPGRTLCLMGKCDQGWEGLWAVCREAVAPPRELEGRSSPKPQASITQSGAGTRPDPEGSWAVGAGPCSGNAQPLVGTEQDQTGFEKQRLGHPLRGDGGVGGRRRGVRGGGVVPRNQPALPPHRAHPVPDHPASGRAGSGLPGLSAGRGRGVGGGRRRLHPGPSTQ